MLKMNYSDLSPKSREQIVKECNKRGIPSYPHEDTMNLIGKIIAHDAYFEGRNDVINNRAPKVEYSSFEKKPHPISRKKYHVTTEDRESYYLKLTDEQFTFLDWLVNHNINLYSAEVYQMEDIEWETP